MNIVILHYTCPPILGGVENVIRAHTQLLAGAGHKVTLLAGRGSAVDGVAPMHHLPLLDSKNPLILDLHQELSQGIVSQRFYETRDRILEDLRPHLERADIVITHNVMTLHKNLALTSAVWHLPDRAVQAPMIHWCHDLAWTNPQYLPELHSGEPWSLLKSRMPGARYVAVSADRAQQLAELWQTSNGGIDLVPNGLDMENFLCLSTDGQRIISRLRLLQHELLLLLPARLTRRKNIELAMRVTADLVARGIDATLVVTGPPGPHNVANEQYLQELDTLRRCLGVEENLLLLHLEHDEDGESLKISDRVVADLYAISDALLFPSRQEGFGIPILEAGLTRVPIFCSDLEPLRELAGDEAHYFSPDSSPPVVADLIEQWMQTDPAYKLRRRVVHGYTWQAIMDAYIQPLLTEVRARSEGVRRVAV